MGSTPTYVVVQYLIVTTHLLYLYVKSLASMFTGNKVTPYLLGSIPRLAINPTTTGIKMFF